MATLHTRKNVLLSLVLFSTLILLLANGCQKRLSQSIPLGEHFYDDVKNWVVLDSSIPVFASDFDVFLLYPTQVDLLNGYYINWQNGTQGRDIYNYVRLFTENQFGKRVRIFSPFVPQLDYKQYTELLNANKEVLTEFNLKDSSLSLAIRYTVKALQNYMGNYHKTKRPFFLVGYEQGAVILYEALRQCPNLNLDNGMVAAYFLGIPGITEERIKKDFKKHNLVPAKGHLDLGVVVIVNTRMPDTPIEETYSTPGGYVINPLNWCTDDTIASRELNEGAVFYKRSEKFIKNRPTLSPNFCSAEIDLENALVNIFDLPKGENEKQQVKIEAELKELLLNEKCLHSNAWGVFAKNIASNAYARTQHYLFRNKVLPPADKLKD